MLTFIVVLFVFSLLIIIHELGHMIVAKRLGVRVERFSLGFGKKIFGIKKGDTEYILSIFPFGGYVKMAGDNPAESKGTPDEFFSKSPFKRFLIVAGGPLTNYVFAFILFTSIFIIGMPTYMTRVGKLLPDYPAAESGLKVGDVIVAIEDRDIKYWDDLVEIVRDDTSGEPLDFKIKRAEKTIDLEIAPKIIKTRNIFGQETIIGMIGIAPQQDIVFVRHNILQAAMLGGKKLFKLTALTYKGLWLLITGGLPVKESVTGPIGIAFLIGEAAKMGFIYLLTIMAHINMALAIFNLLPFPVLDGGHILFLAIEKMRGRPVSPRAQEIASQIALYILIAFAVFISWNDITRFLPFTQK